MGKTRPHPFFLSGLLGLLSAFALFLLFLLAPSLRKSSALSSRFAQAVFFTFCAFAVVALLRSFRKAKPCSWSGNSLNPAIPKIKLLIALSIAEVDHNRRRTEPIRRVADIDYSDDKPDAADSLSQVVQIPPDVATHDKANQRQYGVLQKAPLFAPTVSMDRELPEARKIYPCECKKSSKIQ
jgi:hypothetical protein